jgi:hypothetical protein
MDAHEWRRKYHAALQSDHWKNLKSWKWRLHEGRCENCGDPADDLHHLTYAHLGCERPDEVQLLCVWCHHIHAHKRHPVEAILKSLFEWRRDRFS